MGGCTNRMKKGILYGIGVGPGDPELLTLKALRLIKESDIVVVPGENPKDSVAYQIVQQVYEELAEKRLVAVSMPMTKDVKILDENHKRGTKIMAGYLDQGLKVVYLTLGDPSVYSTYLYVHHYLKNAGYHVEMVSGITSFCAVAARLSIGLVEKAEALHIIPASYQIEEALKLSGTKVFMKTGKKMKDVKQVLLKASVQAVMIENCGMENEKIYDSIDAIPDQSSYYSLIIVKDRRENEV